MKQFLIIISVTILMTACSKKDYLIDGGVHNSKVNQTTFDFIKGNKELDLFAYLIEKAGYKDLVNTPDATVFVADNMAIRKYLNRVFVKQVDQTGNHTPFTIDNIPLQTLKDSLKIYIVYDRIERKDLDENGFFYTTAAGDMTKVTLEKRYNDPTATDINYGSYMSTVPEFIFIRRKLGLNWDDPKEINISPTEKDKYEVIKTSGIITNTGVVHVIGGARDGFYDKNESHTLFFHSGSDRYIP